MGKKATQKTACKNYNPANKLSTVIMSHIKSLIKYKQLRSKSTDTFLIPQKYEEQVLKFYKTRVFCTEKGFYNEIQNLKYNYNNNVVFWHLFPLSFELNTEMIQQTKIFQTAVTYSVVTTLPSNET